MEAIQRSWKTVCFDDVSELDIVFAIDTSGSMYPYLPFVKRELSKWLHQQQTHQPSRRFNLVHYSALATKWQPQSLSASNNSIAEAEVWLDRLHCSTTSNVIDALVLAFADPFAEAVCLITDESSDNPTSLVLEHVARVSGARPVHVVLFQQETGNSLSPFCTGLYERLVLRTGGRLQLVHVPRRTDASRRLPHEPIRVDTYIKSAAQRTEDERLRLVLHSPTFSDTKPSTLPRTAWDLIRGMRVIARRNRDGVYYAGKIYEQLDSTTVNIKFDYSLNGNFDLIQATPICDVVSLVDANHQKISLDDSVLARYGEKGAYYPGTVTEEAIQKNGSGLPSRSFTVTLYDGTKVCEVKSDQAIGILPDKSRRIVKELKAKEKILLGTTGEESVLEEKLLQIDAGDPNDWEDNSLSQTSTRRSSLSQETLASSFGVSKSSELSVESQTPAPGTVLSLGLSFSEGYRAGFVDGLSSTTTKKVNLQKNGASDAKPRWRWWKGTPSPQQRSDFPDVDAMIRSKRHQCQAMAKSQSLSALPSCETHRKGRTTVGELIHQRPHTADPAYERDQRLVDCKRRQREEWTKRQEKTDKEVQSKQQAMLNYKRQVAANQLASDASRSSAHHRMDEQRVRFLSAEREKRESGNQERKREEQERNSHRDLTLNARRMRTAAWEQSREENARKNEQQRQGAFKSREVQRSIIKTEQWTDGKRWQDQRVDNVKARRKARDERDVREENKMLNKMELKEYAESHKRLAYRGKFMP